MANGRRLLSIAREAGGLEIPDNPCDEWYNRGASRPDDFRQSSICAETRLRLRIRTAFGGPNYV